MEDRIKRLEQQLKVQKVFLAILSLTLLSIGFVSFIEKPNEVLRVKGIVVVDSLGKERILIGAPVPYAKNRVRTDIDRVKKAWGDGPFKGTDYMKWYADYNHSTNGIIILDKNGVDRVLIGDPVPDPNIGKRIGPSTGIAFNDQNGFERTGYGILKVAKGNRVVLGLDGAYGSEAAALSVYENGEAGLSFYGQDKHRLFIGKSPENVQTKEKFNGLILFEDTVPIYSINSYKLKK